VDARVAPGVKSLQLRGLSVIVCKPALIVPKTLTFLVALALLTGALCTSAYADGPGGLEYTVTGSSGETNTLEIFRNIFGPAMSGDDWCGATYTDETVVATRVYDYNDPCTQPPVPGDDLYLLSSSLSPTATDQVWTDGQSTVTARARYAGNQQRFGYDAGSGYVEILDIGDNTGFFDIAADPVTFGPGSIWAWVRTGSGQTWYSSEADNSDDKDHLITYYVTGLNDGQVTWVLFWDDQAGGGDRDFNDFVLVITAVALVPDVVGMTLPDANSAILAVGLAVGDVTYQCSAVPAGRVIDQDPNGGTAVPLGSEVDLVLSAGPCTYTISGTVTAGGSPLADVEITGLPGSPTTNASGYYTATVDYGWSGTATPVKAGYSFSPASADYTNVTSNQSQDYTASLNTYTISGTVTAGGSPLQDVQITGLPGSPTTNASGYYTATVDYGWSGTATPVKAGYSFSPASADYTNVTSNQSQDYTASLNTYTISGTVTAGGSPLQDVQITGLPGSPTTNASGYYTATVDYGWSGTAAPTKAGYSFSPASADYTNVTSNQSQDYTAALNTYTISGTVTAGGSPLADVEISGLPGDPCTNGSGYYTATVDYGWSGTATPVKAGYSFSPASADYTNVTSNQSQDYTAALNTYTISGTVTAGGSPLADVEISGLPGDPCTNGSGYYTATVDYGWSGTATPTKAGYSFSPTSAAYSNVTSNQTQDYTASLNTYTISGTITAGGNPLADVELSGLPGDPCTNGSGYYTATVDYGWSGTATPTKAGYSFSPTSTTYSNVTSNQTQDYTASLNTYTISGTVTAGGSPLADVEISGLPGDPCTNGSGYYTATVDYGWSGTATPTKAGYSFSPTSAAYSNVTSNQTQNYTASLNTYTISGTVTAGGSPLADVAITGLPGSPTTNASGYYTATVDYGWSGTATPVKAGYSFSPASADYTNVTSNQSQDYTASLNTYTISGTVTAGGSPLADVEITGLPGSPTTNASGYYTATVDYGWSGTATPVKAGYSFSPASADYTNVTSNQSQDYTASLNTYTISGTVTAGGSPLQDVQITGLPGSPTTNASGDYTATVDYGWSGTATPVKAGYSFSPASADYTNVTSNQSQDYTAALNTYTISGTVTAGGSPLADVEITGLPGSPTTNASGDYTATVDYGWSGTATPVKAGYSFSPASADYTNVTSNQSQDYTASLNTYTISGTVTAGGSPLQDVQITGLPGSPTTNASGDYTATVDYGWSGTAAPTKAGYSFSPTSAAYSNVTSNQTQDYTAGLSTYTILGTAGANGSINPAGETPVEHGGNLAFTAQPDMGYEVDTWFVDGNDVQTGGAGYALTNITADHVVLVTFKERLECVVPDVVGMSEEDANYAIVAAGFETVRRYKPSEGVPAGYVISQDPSQGPAACGSTVEIVVSLGWCECDGQTYVWTNTYPWSFLWVSPWNWDPVAPYGGPGITDIALIPIGLDPLPPGEDPPGPIMDTDIDVCRIYGPAHDANGEQTVFVIKDANVLIVDGWEAHPEPAGIGTIIFGDNARVTSGGSWLFSEHGTVILNITDNADIYVGGELRGAFEADGYLEINMDSGNLLVDGDLRAYRDGSFLFNFSGDAVVESGGYLGGRAYSDTSYGEINISDDAHVICDDLNFLWGAGSGELNMSGGMLDINGDLGLGIDNDFAAPAAATINMTGGLVTMGGNFRFPGNDDSTGFCTLNLTGGVIDVGNEFEHETDNWVVNICGDGVMIINGDVVDEIREQEAEGHWLACPGENCRGEFGSTYDLMVEYDTLEYPGKTKIWADKNLEQAWAPSPEDGATGVSSLGVDLCWCPGESAEVHHVFFSDVEAAVEARDMGTYIGPLHGHDNTCWPTGPLMLGQTYYWAVDEQDIGITIVQGDVWEFTVEECRAIEDMEAYTMNPNLIYETWYDGCGYWVGEQLISNGTGSCVDLAMDKLHGGAKAMVYTYENVYQSLWERDHNYSEARREFDPALNLTASGEAAMVVWFHGNKDNDVTNMWVLLNDGAAATYGDNGDDPADITKEEWIDWNIDLAGFTGLSAVSSMSIGFGDKVGNVPDDALGIMWFDDISVCPVRCVPKYTTDIFDLNGDCITDWKDVGIQAGNWLEDRR